MMKKIFYFFVLILTFAFCFLSFCPEKVKAQQISLSISPPLLKTYIKPGKAIMVAYRVDNFGDPAILTAKIRSFEPLDNLGNIRIKDNFEGPIRFSLDNANLQLDQPFFLKTRASEQLLLRIRIPDGAPEGDYYYTLLVESQPPSTAEGVHSAGAKATIGSNILITVTNTGIIDIKGKVALFDVLSRWQLKIGDWKINLFDSNDKIPVILVLQNNGKNVITSEGNIVMKGNFGETAKYDLIPQNILSQSQRLVTATDSAIIDCLNNPSGKTPIYCKKPITLLISGFFVGVYKLSTIINFGENSPNIFASTSFIAIPFKLLVALTVAIIISIFIIKRLTRKDEE